ncbi:MAG TPA: NADH-quinone oxidoreductase subunit N [Armatimonadota bacterium]|jgi:NADH-quinone oxidoreductase subunit N
MSPFNSYLLMAPEIILTLLGVALILVAVFTESPEHRLSKAVPILCALGLAAALASVVYVGVHIVDANLSGVSLNVDRGGHLRVDLMSLFFKGIAITATILVTLMAVEYGRRFSSPGEFYGLIVFTALAVSFLCSAADLITIYLSMEFLSITSYAMAGYYRENARSNEAALKYFLYGAINSALMLYGISLLYGLSATIPGHPATTNLTDVIRGLSAQPLTPLALAAVVFTLSGFFFKVSAVPFHQWAPDTYQGAPTPFTAFLSVASKVGGVAILVRVVGTIVRVPSASYGTSYSLPEMVIFLVAIVATLSMFIGNLVAIQQRDIKRLLAYSGIGQIGYMLVAVASMGSGNMDKALQAMVIYMVIYLFMNLGAFGVVTAINNRLQSSDLDDYNGLAKRNLWLSTCMAIFMLSLSGIPFAAGWFAKYYIFFAAIDPSLHGIFSGGRFNAQDALALMLALNSVIAAYYYLNVVQRMFFMEPETDAEVTVSGPLKAGILVSVAATLILGVVISPLYDLTREHATFRPDPPSAPAQVSER